jgi:hypothetical protein
MAELVSAKTTEPDIDAHNFAVPIEDGRAAAVFWNFLRFFVAEDESAWTRFQAHG